MEDLDVVTRTYQELKRAESQLIKSAEAVALGIAHGAHLDSLRAAITLIRLRATQNTPGSHCRSMTDRRPRHTYRRPPSPQTPRGARLCSSEQTRSQTRFHIIQESKKSQCNTSLETRGSKAPLPHPAPDSTQRCLQPPSRRQRLSLEATSVAGSPWSRLDQCATDYSSSFHTCPTGQAGFPEHALRRQSRPGHHPQARRHRASPPAHPVVSLISAPSSDYEDLEALPM